MNADDEPPPPLMRAARWLAAREESRALRPPVNDDAYHPEDNIVEGEDGEDEIVVARWAQAWGWDQDPLDPRGALLEYLVLNEGLGDDIETLRPWIERGAVEGWVLSGDASVDAPALADTVVWILEEWRHEQRKPPPAIPLARPLDERTVGQDMADKRKTRMHPAWGRPRAALEGTRVSVPN